MLIRRAEIENFRKIQHLIIEALGNHIRITGPNGVGKSTIFELLAIALGGKKFMLPDAVTHGAEEARFKWELSEGKGTATTFEIVGVIRPGNILSLDVFTFNRMLVTKKNVDGRVRVDSPINLLEKLAPKDFIDPISFINKDGAGRIAMLYKLLPGLKEEIDKLTSQYVDEQVKRSQISIDKKRDASELLNTLGVSQGAGESLEDAILRGFTIRTELREEEIDAADLLEELNAARTHNLQLSGFEIEAKNKGNDIAITEEMHVATLRNINILQNDLAKAQERATELINQANAYKATLSEIEAKKAAFKLKDEKEIEGRIANLNATNESIRKNIKSKDLQKQLEAKATEYSVGLEEMKKIDEKKIQVYRDAHMPVEGLAVGNDDLMYPDPVTGEQVSFAQLSSGQKCRAAVEILAPFLPDPDKGLRCMLISNAESLDEKNYAAVLEAAEKNGIQLALHKTTWEAGDLQVVIEGQEEVLVKQSGQVETSNAEDEAYREDVAQ